MAYNLSNNCAKNFYKWTALVQLIIENVGTRFLGTQCILLGAFTMCKFCIFVVRL